MQKSHDSTEETIKHRRIDLEETRPHRPVIEAPATIVQTAPPPPSPTPPPVRKKRRRRRSCLGCLAKGLLAGGILTVLGVGLLAAAYWLFPPARMNILLLGVDARSAQETVVRTDTMLLATVDPSQPYVGMLSIPRDLYVNIPDGYGANRINAAYVFGELEGPGGGATLAMQTVAGNFGVPVTRYVQVDFAAFVAIVDAAGGVTIDVESYFVDYEYPTPDYGTMVVEFEAGEQLMDGERALQYARIRHGSSDMARSRRQQQVIEALARQLINPVNWWRLPAVYRAFTSHVETNLTFVEIVRLLPAAVWVGPGSIDHRVFDETMAQFGTSPGGGSILEPLWGGITPVTEEMFLP